MGSTDTSAIQRVIGRARLRIRAQWALEGSTTALIVAAATALVAVFAMRTEMVAPATGLYLLMAAGAVVVLGAVIGASRPLDDEVVARRIDRASNLADRLSTAIAFQRGIAGAASADADGETRELMLAAIRDGVRAAPRANVVAATPFVAPRDLRAAVIFLAVSALTAGLAIPTTDRAPRLYRAEPSFGPPGSEATLIGENLLTGVVAPLAGLPGAARVLGAPDVAADAAAPRHASSAAVYLSGAAGEGRPVVILEWTRAAIKIRIPHDAPIGDALLTVHAGERKLGPIAFTVVDPKDAAFHKEGSVALDPDERAYVDAILAELKAIAKRDGIEDLDAFTAKIEQLLTEAEEGKITKEQLLEALAKAEEALRQGAEPNQAELDKQLAELGKELAKSEQTKDLGKALEQHDLDKAKQELEKLAAKLDKQSLEHEKEQLEKKLADKGGELSEKEKQELQKKLAELEKKLAEKQELQKKLADPNLSEKDKQELQKKLDQLSKNLTDKQKEELQKKLQQVAKQMDKQQKDQQQKAQNQQQKLEDEVRRLQKEKEQAKTEKDKLSAERRLQQKQDELKKLQKDEEKKQQSAQRDAVKRLQKDLEQAAENLQKPQQPEDKGQQEEREKQASQKLKDAARETGRVDKDKRKQAQQKRMSSQMDDLREAMRRAKQKGNKGPQDPFNKNGKNKDFQARARGQKGSGEAWRPGQGQGQGQGGQGQQPGQQGGGKGGKEWGTGTDPNLTGDATGKSGNTKDEDLQGQAGSKGTSRRETILAAAQKGFASTSYKKVFTDYQRIVEEVMRTEKLPSSYKYYVKRYFAKIHPSAGVQSEAAPDSAP